MVNAAIYSFFGLFLIIPRLDIEILFTILVMFSMYCYLPKYKQIVTSSMAAKIQFIYTAFFLLTIISLLCCSNHKFSYLENYYKLSLFIPLVYLFANRVNLEKIPTFINVGVVVSLVLVIYNFHLGDSRPVPIENGVNPVQFGNFILFLSVFSFGLNYYYQNKLKLINVVIIFLAIITAILNQTRGGLIIIPLVIVLFLIMYPRHIKQVLLYTLSAVILITTVHLFTHILDSSFARIMGSYTELRTKSDDSSMGMRREMWNASWLMFKSHPFFGVGLSNWPSELANQIKQGVASNYLSQFNQPHNEYMFYLSTMGILGLLSFLCVLLAPIYLLRKSSRELMFLLLILSGSFLISSLTQAVFTHRDSFTLYLVCISIVFALAQKAPTK